MLQSLTVTVINPASQAALDSLTPSSIYPSAGITTEIEVVPHPNKSTLHDFSPQVIFVDF